MLMNQVRHMTSMAARRVAYRTGVSGASPAAAAGAAPAIQQPIQIGFLGAAKSDVRETQRQMAVSILYMYIYIEWKLLFCVPVNLM